jgi:thiol:disulfide interchange protein DsbC
MRFEMVKKWLLAVCVSGFALTVCADVVSPTVGTPAAVAVRPTDAASGVSPAVDKMVRQAVKSLAATAEVDSIAPAPLPGFYQVIASGHLLYVSADGKYALDGELLDLARHQNASDAAWAGFRKAELTKVPAAARIVYAPEHPKYTVTVFTDVNCGYCRALHEHVAAFNRAGIAVEYLAWPREGVTTTAGRLTPTYAEMVSVWCASDRKAAFGAATGGRAPAPATCANPVKDQFNLGVRLGITGTPTIIAADGRALGGYLTPEQLLAALKKAG